MAIRRVIFALALAAALSTVIGCGAYGGGEEPGAGSPTQPSPTQPGPPGSSSGGLEPKLSSIQKNIFDVSYAVSGCHKGDNPEQGLNLEAGQALKNLVNVPSRGAPSLMRMKPSDSANSYLVQKIEGRAGSRMPRGKAPLSAEQIAAIKTWIDQGAQDN